MTDPRSKIIAYVTKGSFINYVMRDADFFVQNLSPPLFSLPFITLRRANFSPGFNTSLREIIASRYQFKLLLLFWIEMGSGHQT